MSFFSFFFPNRFRIHHLLPLSVSAAWPCVRCTHTSEEFPDYSWIHGIDLLNKLAQIVAIWRLAYSIGCKRLNKNWWRQIGCLSGILNSSPKFYPYDLVVDASNWCRCSSQPEAPFAEIGNFCRLSQICSEIFFQMALGKLWIWHFWQVWHRKISEAFDAKVPVENHEPSPWHDSPNPRNSTRPQLFSWRRPEPKLGCHRYEFPQMVNSLYFCIKYDTILRRRFIGFNLA